MSDTLKKELEEKDKEIASLKEQTAGLIEELALLESALPIDPVTLSKEELRSVLLASKTSLVHDSGSVYIKQDGGIYCQINRPGIDGSLHVYVQVPDEFTLDQYTPPTE